MFANESMNKKRRYNELGAELVLEMLPNLQIAIQVLILCHIRHLANPGREVYIVQPPSNLQKPQIMEYSSMCTATVHPIADSR